jgi:hypothetical protein
VVHLVAGDFELECDKIDSRDAFVSARFDDCDFLVAAELAQLLRFRVDGGLGWRFEAELELHVYCSGERFRYVISGGSQWTKRQGQIRAALAVVWPD